MENRPAAEEIVPVILRLVLPILAAAGPVESEELSVAQG